MHKHMHSYAYNVGVDNNFCFFFVCLVRTSQHKEPRDATNASFMSQKTIVYIYLFFFLFLFIHYFLLFHYLLNNLFCFNFSHLKREMVIAGRLVGGMSGGWLVDMRAGDVLTCVTYKFKVSLPL